MAARPERVMRAYHQAADPGGFSNVVFGLPGGDGLRPRCLRGKRDARHQASEKSNQETPTVHGSPPATVCRKIR